MVYIWVFDSVEDDILARHNKHFAQTHHLALRGVKMLHYQRHNLPRALRALTSATTNIRNCSILSFGNASAVKAVDSKKQLSKLSHLAILSTLCHWVRIYILNPYIAEKMKWFVLQFERMILFRTAKRCFWGRQLLQDGVCFVQSSTTKTTSSLINGNPHSSIALLLFVLASRTKTKSHEIISSKLRILTLGGIWLHSQLPSTRVYGDYQLIIAINSSIVLNNRTRSAAECHP